MGKSNDGIAKRVLAAIISLILSMSGLPTQALAEAARGADAVDAVASEGDDAPEASVDEASTEPDEEAPTTEGAPAQGDETAEAPDAGEESQVVEGGPNGEEPSTSEDQTEESNQLEPSDDTAQQVDEYQSDAAIKLAAQAREESEDDAPKAEVVGNVYKRLARTLAGVDQDEFALELKGRLTASKDVARLFKLVMDELKVECIEIMATDDSATWNMVKVDDAWYHVDAWRAGERYAMLLKEAEDASAVEVPLDWLLVGDERMAAPEDSSLRWKRSDGEKAPESAGDYADKHADEVDGADSKQEDGADAQQVEQDQQNGEDSQDAVLTAQGTTIVDSGTCGTCPWSLDSEGTLTIGAGTLASNDENYDVNYLYARQSWPWFSSDDYWNESIKKVQFRGKVFAGESMRSMFSRCGKLQTFDASGLDTSAVKDMSFVFEASSSLQSLDLDSWDTSGVVRMDCMFEACYKLRSLSISNWNTSSVTSMDNMFGCAPKDDIGCCSLTTLDLSGWDTSSVTDMGSMFSGCSSLASVGDLSGWDTSSVTDMGSMFSDCSSIASLDLSGWDTSSVMDMSSMFSDCSSIASLDLSGWDTSSTEEMYNMFSGCSSLKTILVSGLWSTANVHPAPEWLEADGVFSNCTSLVGGNGTVYNPNHTGIEYARIDAPGSPGYLTRGYGSHEANPNYALASVKMHKTNDREYDLLTTTRSIDVLNKDTVCQFKAELKDPTVTAKKYTLYQKIGEGYNVLSEAGPDGNFESLTYGDFIASYPVYVSVTGQNGKIAQTKKLLLNVEDSKKTKVPQSLSLGDDIDITFNGWPFNGMKFSMPFRDSPLSVSYSDDGKIRIGVNIDLKKAEKDPGFLDKVRDKGFYEDMLNDAKYKNFLIDQGYVSGFGKLTPKIAGYLEGTVGSNKFTGQIAIKLSYKWNREVQHVIVFVPVVTEISIEGELHTSATLSFRLEDARPVWDENGPEVRLGGKVSLGFGAGVGAAYICSIMAWAKGSFGLEYLFLPRPQCGLEEAYVDGSFGFKAKIFGKNFPLTLLSGKHYLYKRDTSMGAQSVDSQSPTPADLLMSIQSDDTGTSMDRSYKDKTSAWNGATHPEQADQLQSNVYPDARVQTVPVDGGLLMTFLTDDVARNDDNRSMLVWSRYDEATGVWSDPQPVWQDGTADLSHYLCADGAGGAWITWSNARQAVTDGLTLSDEAALLDVAAAHFDAGSNAIGGAEFVTDDSSVFEASPHVGVAGGSPVIAWTQNGLDDVLGTSGEHNVVVATPEGSSWTSRHISTAAGMVTSLEVGELAGAASVAWATDADGDQETVEDSSVWAWRDGADAATLGESSAWNPRFALADGASVLTWSQGGALKYTSDGTTIEDAELNDLPVAAYELSGDLAGDALLTYAYYENGSGNVRGRTCATGSWSPEVAYTTQGQSVTSWGANLVGGVPVLAYATSTETEAESKDAGIWFTSGSAMAAVSVSDAWYEDGKIHAVVANVGPTAVSSVALQGGDSNGGQYETHHEDPIAPGESVELEMEVNEPALGKATTYSVLAKPSPDVTQPTEVTVGEASLRASTEHKVVDGKESFVTTVSNAGLAPSPAGKMVFYNYETGESIHEETFDALPGGQSRSVAYSRDGMLSTSGIRTVGVRVEDNDGNVLASDLSDAWEGEVDEQFDWDAPGADKASIAHATVSVANQAYTGRAITPTPTVKVGTKTLAEGTDYTLSYANNTAVGKATVTVRGKGAYRGSKAVTFQIVPADVSKATVAPIKGRGYDGKPYEPKPKVTLGGRTLVEGTDYTLSYKNNVYASNGKPATLTVTGKGNYTGTATANFDVWKNGQPMDAWAVARQAPAASLRTRDVTVESPIHVAHAVSAAKPMEYRKVGGDSRLNVELSTGRVTIRKGTPAGTYKVKIRAIAFGGANYADGSRTVECPVQVVGGKLDQSFAVTANDVTRTAGSLVSADYLTRPFKVSEGVGNVSYKRASGSGCLDVDSAGRLRVKRGTTAGTYYVKVWATAAGDAGYRPCTRTLTVKVTVTSRPVSALTIQPPGDQVYTGAALTPKPTVKDGGTTLVEGRHYSLAYEDNVAAGTATITVRGMGDYTGTRTVTFQIVPASVIGAEVQVVYPDGLNYIYGLEPATPPVVVTLAGAELVEGRDYEVTYRANVLAGTAVVAGKGNYRDATCVTIKHTRAGKPSFPGMKTLQAAELEIPKYMFHTGTEVELGSAFSGTCYGINLVPGTNCRLSYKYNVDVGTALLEVFPIWIDPGNYDSPSVDDLVQWCYAQFDIIDRSKADLEHDVYFAKVTEAAGSSQLFSVTLAGKTLREGIDYVVTRKDGKPFAISGIGEYRGAELYDLMK